MLGTLAALLLAVGAPAAATTADTVATHASLVAGHSTEGVVSSAQPRPTLPLPPAAPAFVAGLGVSAPRPSAEAADHDSPRPKAVPPNAIRGPPA